jgi:threonine/homoserine/homoserine lactone efflux protein
MPNLDLFLKGLVIGFAIAAPVGPIGILCIRRTLSDGHLAGFVSGLGAAGADTAYGLVAALGLSLIGPFLEEHRNLISVVGGCFLLYLGITELRSRTVDPNAPPPRPAGLIGHFVSTFFWTLANPITILSFIAVYTGLNVAGPGGAVGSPEREYAGVTALVAGVFGGSALWWLLLTTSVDYLRFRLGPQTVRWPSWIAGVLIIGFGIYALTALRYLV